MNIFRLIGDLTHLMSIIVLLLKIHTIKSCAGTLLATPSLFVLTFSPKKIVMLKKAVMLKKVVLLKNMVMLLRWAIGFGEGM